MQTRNSIVHRGQKSEWDPELAKIIVKTHFFIHATAWITLGEVLLQDNYSPHKISNVDVWRKGVEGFCDDLAEIYDCDVLTCLACHARSVISGELFVLEDGNSDENIVCLCCLSSINIELEARLIDCYECYETSYLINALNVQEGQRYIGKCSECDTDTYVRKCSGCEDFFHPLAEETVKVEHGIYCSEVCRGIHDLSDA